MTFELRDYSIRRKVLKIFGASFHVFDSSGRVVAFSSQKAFKLKEDIRVFTDESMSSELMAIRARQIVDFSAAYDIVDSSKSVKIGAARRKGWSSMGSGFRVSRMEIFSYRWEVVLSDSWPDSNCEVLRSRTSWLFATTPFPLTLQWLWVGLNRRQNLLDGMIWLG